MIAPLSIPSPPEAWAVWNIPVPWGVIPVHTYALCILAGIIVAVIWTHRRLTARGGEPWIVLDIALWAVPLGIIFARAYHVFTHPGDYFYPGADLLKTLYIWEGGNAIFGSLIGGALGAYIGCRITGIRFWSFADALAPGLLAAQALGRLGNYFNHELFGLPTTLPWGLQIESTNAAFPAGLPDGTLFHPTFLYEIIWNVVGIAVILFLERRFSLRWGKAFGVYLIWYGIGRSFFESIRIDPSEMFLGVRTNVWAAWLAAVIGIVIIIVQRRRHPGAEISVYRPGKQWTPDPGDEYADDAEDEADADAGVESHNSPAVEPGEGASPIESSRAEATSTSGTP